MFINNDLAGWLVIYINARILKQKVRVLQNRRNLCSLLLTSLGRINNTFTPLCHSTIISENWTSHRVTIQTLDVQYMTHMYAIFIPRPVLQKCCINVIFCLPKDVHTENMFCNQFENVYLFVYDAQIQNNIKLQLVYLIMKRLQVTTLLYIISVISQIDYYFSVPYLFPPPISQINDKPL